MRRIWEKTVDKVTVGFGQAMNMTGARKNQGDERYVERMNILEKIEKEYRSLQRSTLNFATAVANVGDNQNDVAQEFGYAFENGEDQYHEMSISIKVASELTKESMSYTAKSVLHDKTVKPVDDCIKECNNLRKIARKCNKNLILLEANQAKLEKANAKGKLVPEVQANVEKRQTKYNRYLEEFVAGVDRLNASKIEFFQKILEEQQKAMKTVADDLYSKYTEEYNSFPAKVGMQNFPPIA